MTPTKCELVPEPVALRKQNTRNATGQSAVCFDSGRLARSGEWVNCPPRFLTGFSSPVELIHSLQFMSGVLLLVEFFGG